MKVRPWILLTVAAACMMSGGARLEAQSAAPPPPTTTANAPSATEKAKREGAERERERQDRIHAKWNVTVDIQMVRMEEARTLELIPDLQSADRQTNDAAWARLQGMIKRKEATLVAWPFVRTSDGSRAVCETIVEERYPTEFDPPQEPQTFIPGPGPAKPGPVDDATVLDLPIAYEIRNTGVTLEVRPIVLRGGGQVGLRLTVSRIELLEFADCGFALTSHNTLVTALQPLFGNWKCDCDLKLESGQRRLIAVHKLAKPANAIELHFVRAVVAPVE